MRARVVANAAGPWIPEVGRGPAGRKLTGALHGLAYGANVMARSLAEEHALAPAQLDNLLTSYGMEAEGIAARVERSPELRNSPGVGRDRRWASSRP